MKRRFYLPDAHRKSNGPDRRPGTATLWTAIAAVGVLAVLALLLHFGESPESPQMETESSAVEDSTLKTAGEEPAAPEPADSTGSPEDDTVSVEGEALAPDSGIVLDSAAADTAEEVDVKEVIRLQVLNGCGVPGLTRRMTPALRKMGFDVREVGNAGHFGYDHTLIIGRSGSERHVDTVADSIGVDPLRVTLEPSEELVDIDVTVIVGSDYKQLNVQLESF